MHYGKRFPFVDLLIVTMITYGRLSLSGVVGDHPGETTIRKGRSMNIQLMNVAVDIIEQRLAPLANVLTRNNHITAMRDSFALAMPFVIVGSLLVPILFPPVSIDGASRFGQVYLLLRPILQPTFQLTIGLVALIVAFGASASLAKQYRLPEPALRFNRVSGFSAVYRLSRDCGEQCLSRRYGDIYRPDIQHLFH